LRAVEGGEWNSNHDDGSGIEGNEWDKVLQLAAEVRGG
jgi:hypothetical protein